MLYTRNFLLACAFLVIALLLHQSGLLTQSRRDDTNYCADASAGAILITGCSSGIGMHMAIDLANDGYLIYATVRNNASSAQLMNEWTRRSPTAFSAPCSTSSAGEIVPVNMDVTDSKSVASAADFVRNDLKLRKFHRRLVGIVNNAAVAHILPVELVDLQKFRHLLDTNLIGPVAVLKYFLPLFRASQADGPLSSGGPGSRGRVVMISSIAAYFATPMYGAYAASKAGLEAMSDAARMELASSNISVSIIEVGSIKGTAMRAKNSGDNAAHRSISEDERNLYSTLFDTMNGLVQRIESNVKDGPEVVVREVRSALSDPLPSARYYAGGAMGPWLSARIVRRAASLLPDGLMDKIKSAAMK
jgi:NAD(P)-dependent dehydrogenase (short-subunit alcohol dehydrogenase family)